MRRSVAFGIALFVAATSLRAAPTDVRAVNAELDRSFEAADVRALDRLIRDDFTFVGRDGSVASKQEVLALFGAGTIHFREIIVTEVDVRSWRGTAIVTGRARTHGNRLGRPIDEEVRYTRTFLQIEGRWQLAAEQVTRIE
ncbi:MAG: nuclear transport factor 2 family protein [Acidobacteria bacterium]|nr:nuclear transport factor 2 family protein [Acidobacteriota bacterium]